jgi:hypothetical protein
MYQSPDLHHAQQNCVLPYYKILTYRKFYSVKNSFQL